MLPNDDTLEYLANSLVLSVDEEAKSRVSPNILT